MEYLVALDAIINRGIAAARRDYTGWKLRGAVEGFEACRGKTTGELRELLMLARGRTERARRESARMREAELEEHYWRHRCYEAEVEWVANCVSVMLHAKGLPTIVPPTERAVETVASVVGVAAPD